MLGPITSHYRWEGRTTRATEWLVAAKTTAEAADRVVHAITSEHPYDVPEVVITPIVGGHAAYLDWVAAESSAESDPERT